MDNALSSSFKSAANNVALLYKEALISNKTSYESGYKHCLSDLWSYLTSIQSSSTSVLSLSDLESFIQMQTSKLSKDLSTLDDDNSLKRSFSGSSMEESKKSKLY